MYMPLSDCILMLRLFLSLCPIGCSCSFFSVCHFLPYMLCLSIPDVISLFIQSQNSNMSLTFEFDNLSGGKIAPSFCETSNLVCWLTGNFFSGSLTGIFEILLKISLSIGISLFLSYFWQSSKIFINWDLSVLFLRFWTMVWWWI